MEQVLKLDKDCEEAVNNLFNCKVLQLMVTPTHKSSVDVTRIICMPSPNDSCDPRQCFFFFFQVPLFHYSRHFGTNIYSMSCLEFWCQGHSELKSVYLLICCIRIALKGFFFFGKHLAHLLALGNELLGFCTQRLRSLWPPQHTYFFFNYHFFFFFCHN